MRVPSLERLREVQSRRRIRVEDDVGDSETGRSAGRRHSLPQ
jgi:hypothetical protein